MNNAIIVNWLNIEKVNIDFSDFKNIEEAIGASHLYTIHTAKTMEISNILGFHIMGFIDRDGDDVNNSLACKICGYDYIGSSMVLFKTDDSFNPLPLSEEEVDKLYLFLTEGKVEPKKRNEDFFTKFGIRPILPNFDADGELKLNNDYPTLGLVIYDLKNEDFIKVGEELFRYSSLMLESFEKVDSYYKANDGSYFIKNTWYCNREYFIVGIEANRVGKSLYLDNLDNLVTLFINSNDGDAIEEAQDDEYEDYEMSNLYLKINVNGIWKYEQTELTRKYSYVHPFAFGDNLNFPGFEEILEVNGIDEINETIDLLLYLKDETKEFSLKIDEPLEIKICDLLGYEDMNIECNAFVLFTLCKDRFIGLTIDKKLEITYDAFNLNDGEKLIVHDEYEFDSIDLDSDDVAEVGGDTLYVPALISEDENSVILISSPKEDEDDNFAYMLVDLGSFITEEFIYSDESRSYKIITIIGFKK